jgi:hypothetical protein
MKEDSVMAGYHKDFIMRVQSFPNSSAILIDPSFHIDSKEMLMEFLLHILA